jgi:hypothetical protein
MDILPCQHDQHAVVQIAPATNLLKTLDTRYPQVLIPEGIVPEDYHTTQSQKLGERESYV